MATVPLAGESGCLLVRLSPDSSLCFSTASDYLQHLISNGVCYAGVRVEARGPLSCQLQVEPAPPALGSLCQGDEAQFFAPTSPQSITRKRSTVDLQLLTTDDQDQEGLSGHLLYALCHGLVQGLQQVVEASTYALDLSSPLQCANDQGLTPLAIAALLPSPQCLELLLVKGVPVDGIDSRGRTALHWAVLGGRLASVKALLKHSTAAGALSNHDEQGFTPLLCAALAGAPEIAAALLKAGASPDLPHPSTGVSPLSAACLHGHHDMAKLLLKHRASSAGEQDLLGSSALHCAVWAGSAKCVKLLLSHASSLLACRDQAGRTPLLYAAARGDMVMCQLLLKRGAQRGEVDSAGRTALHWAVISQQTPCVECLLAHPVATSGTAGLCNQPDSHGAAPAHYAAMTGSCELLSTLLDKGGSLTATDASGYSPLVWAAACGHVDATRQLLELNNRGAPSSKDDKSSPSSQYKRDGSLRQGSPLVQEDSDGTKPSLPDNEKDAPYLTADGPLTPLHAAATVGAVEVCQLLTQHSHSAVRSGDGEGRTALHCASLHGHTDCVQVVLAAGAAPDQASHAEQRTSLHLASERGHREVVTRLLQAGAGLDHATYPAGERAIHLAAHGGHASVMQALLDHGCAPDVKRANDSQTALLVAAAAGHVECCRVLVDRGADPGARGSSVERCTALDLALIGGHREVTDYLIKQGAPSGGGVYHRAALTIQAVWRLHRHRRRCRSREQWSAAVIQRAVRRWKGREMARRVRAARERARNRAAAVIQRQWRRYREGRRRYEATSARLRARLRQEHLAASVLLEELQSQAHSIQLPPPSTAPSAPPRLTPLPQPHAAPTPGFLLQASAPPTPRFPSGSLLFPTTRPRKPLTPRHPPRLVSPAPTHRPVPSLATITEQEEGSVVSVGGPSDSKLPPIDLLPSLTAAGSLIKAKTVRGSPLPAASSKIRGSPSSNGLKGVTNRQRHSSKTEEVASSQAASASSQAARSSESLPAIASTGAVTDGGQRQHSSAVVDDVETTLESKPDTKQLRDLEPPTHYENNHEENDHDATTADDTLARKNSGSKVKEASDEREGREKGRLPAASPRRAYMKQTMFRGAPVGHRNEERAEGKVDDRLLGHIQRYDRLNHVLSLLQHARGGESREGERGDEGEGGRLIELREHIRTALDEAVRLRADTDTLQRSTKVKMKSKPIDSVRT